MNQRPNQNNLPNQNTDYQTRQTPNDDELDALPNQPNQEFEPLPNRRKWRREVIKKNGIAAYWIWRRGTGDEREQQWGGNYEDLDDERKQQYQTNCDRRAAAKAQREEKAGEEDRAAIGA
jgi:hypothetical protein